MAEAIIAEAVLDFEHQAKREFNERTDKCSVRLGGFIREDATLGIKDGKLELDG